MNAIQRLGRWSRQRQTDFLIGALLIVVALLCHARYLLPTGLVFATEGDSFRQILPNQILFQRMLDASDIFWSWSFGLGGDAFTELSYAGTTSLFTYLQFGLRHVFGATGTDLFTALNWKLAMSILRLWLAMTLLYALLRKERQKPLYALIGALAYGCAPWFLYRAILFDFMTDVYVLMPLVALAYARYQETGRWTGLSITVALLVGTNLYFGYIACIYFASLFLISTFQKGMAFGEYLRRMAKLLGICILGVLLAAVALLPSANGILSSDRTVANAQLQWIPHADTLRGLFAQLFLGNGKFGLPLVCFLALYLKKGDLDEQTQKRTLLAVLWLVLLLIPATASLMNGLSYETPRWHFVVIFSVACALPGWLHALERHGDIPWWKLAALCAALAALYAVFGERSFSLASAAWLLSFGIGLVAILLAGRGGQLRAGKWGRFWGAALAGCILLSGVLNATGVRVHNIYADQAETLFYGSEEAKTANSELAPQPGEFYRVEDCSIATCDEDGENRPYAAGTYGVSNYASEISGDLSTWHKKTFRFRTTPICAGIYQSFDNRLFHEIAWNVKYKTCVSEQRTMPSVWQKAATASGQTVYENQLDTGFDLWYDSVLPVQDWMKLSTAQKDAALLQAAVISGGQTEQSYPNARTQMDSVTQKLPINFSDAAVSGGTWTDDGLLCVPEQATLTFELPEQTEEGEYLAEFWIEETGGEELFSITANGRTLEKFADRLESESLNYPLKEYAFHFDGTESAVTWTLSRGTYRLEQLCFSFNSYAKLADWVTARNANNLTDLCVQGSRITGKITCGQAGILALSMPVSKGWSCRVDGIKTDLLTVNGIFAAIELQPGNHTVELTFTPPYLLAGWIVTITTAGILLFLHLKSCKNARNAG